MATVRDLIITDKWKDVLKDKSRVIMLEGVTGSGKSLLATLKVYYEIMKMPKNQIKAALVGESVTTLEKNFINHPFGLGLIDLFPNVEYKKNGTGGSRLEIFNGEETKLVELFGYDNKSSYKKIMGGGFSFIMLDEGNLAHEDFLDELFLRLIRNDARLLVTSNGDDPDIKFYEYMNRCYPVEKYKDNIPDSTLDYLNSSEEKEEDWNYYFFGHEDNPKNTLDKIKRLYRSVPKGSYRYITKVLGERGVMTGLCFREYMTPNMFITKEDLMNKRITDMYVGIDAGVRDLTTFVFTGITNKQEVIVIDSFSINNVADDKIYEAFKRWFTPLYNEYKGKIRALMVDSASQHLKLYINPRTRLDYGLQCVNAHKFGDHDIKNRVDLNQQLIHLNKLFFLDKAKEVYKALGKIKYSDKANQIVEDNSGDVSNDWWDAFNYSISRHHIKLGLQM